MASEFNVHKLELSDKHAQLIADVLEIIEIAECDGYKAISSRKITEFLGRAHGDGYLNATLWMLADSGYIYAFSALVSPNRETVWNTTGQLPSSLEELFV